MPKIHEKEGPPFIPSLWHQVMRAVIRHVEEEHIINVNFISRFKNSHSGDVVFMGSVLAEIPDKQKTLREIRPIADRCG